MMNERTKVGILCVLLLLVLAFAAFAATNTLQSVRNLQQQYREAKASLPDTFFYKGVMQEKRTDLGEGGEEQKTRSSVQTEKLHLFGGRPQWMHLVYSG